MAFGAELITDGDFSTNPYSAGWYRINGIPTNIWDGSTLFFQNFNQVIGFNTITVFYGQTYTLQFDIIQEPGWNTFNFGYSWSAGESPAAITVSGTFDATGVFHVTHNFVATNHGTSPEFLAFGDSANGSLHIKNVSLKQVLPSGNSRYWIGGTGLDTDAAHWSTASGGIAGAPAPIATNDVFVDTNSGFGGGGTIQDNGDLVCNNFTSTVGHTYTLAPLLEAYGSVTLEPLINMPNDIEFRGGAIGRTFTPNSATVNGITVGFEGAGITQIGNANILSNGFSIEGQGEEYTLQGNLTTTGQFYSENGVFNANGYNVTAGSVYLFSDIGFTPEIIMGCGVWTPPRASWTLDANDGVNAIIIPCPLSSIYSTDY